MNYKKGGRAHVTVVREHYLRDDIFCKLQGCVVCEGEFKCLLPQAWAGCSKSIHFHFLHSTLFMPAIFVWSSTLKLNVSQLSRAGHKFLSTDMH